MKKLLGFVLLTVALCWPGLVSAQCTGVFGANTVCGTIASGPPKPLTTTQLTALINVATTSLSGALPAWPNNSTTFLRGDGTYTSVGNTALANSSMTIAGHSIALGGTQTIACADLSNGATGCSTATGTSGATIPLLNGANTYSGTSTFSAQLITTFGAPTIGSGACGTGSNGTITGTNQAGKITIGASATVTCTVSFSATITAPNACVLFPGNAAAAATGTTVAYVSTINTTTFVVTGSALANTIYYYHCI
jgi:hypothetical protein